MSQGYIFPLVDTEGITTKEMFQQGYAFGSKDQRDADEKLHYEIVREIIQFLDDYSRLSWADFKNKYLDYTEAPNELKPLEYIKPKYLPNK